MDFQIQIEETKAAFDRLEVYLTRANRPETSEERLGCLTGAISAAGNVIALCELLKREIIAEYEKPLAAI